MIQCHSLKTSIFLLLQYEEVKNRSHSDTESGYTKPKQRESDRDSLKILPYSENESDWHSPHETYRTLLPVQITRKHEKFNEDEYEL